MRTAFIFAITAILAIGCTTNAGTGAIAGGTIGACSGALIGGGGGALIGGAIGAGSGAIIGAILDERFEPFLTLFRDLEFLPLGVDEVFSKADHDKNDRRHKGKEANDAHYDDPEYV